MNVVVQRLFARTVVLLDYLGAGKVPGSRWCYRLLHRLVNAGGERAVVVQGSTMFIDPRDTAITSHLIATGVWEREETNLLAQRLVRGTTFVDVGANIGYFTLLAARTVGPEGLVLAFEPDPRNFALLTRSIQANGYDNVIAVQKGLAEGHTRRRLFRDRLNLGAHSLIEDAVPTPGDGVDVETEPLDDYYDRVVARNADVVVKIDVQGAEGLVCRGGRAVLGHPRTTALVEFWPEGIVRTGVSPRELLAEFVSLGFELAICERGAVQRATGDAILAACERRPVDRRYVNLLLEKRGESG